MDVLTIVHDFANFRAMKAISATCRGLDRYHGNNQSSAAALAAMIISERPNIPICVLRQYHFANNMELAAASMHNLEMFKHFWAAAKKGFDQISTLPIMLKCAETDNIEVFAIVAKQKYRGYRLSKIIKRAFEHKSERVLSYIMATLDSEAVIYHPMFIRNIGFMPVLVADVILALEVECTWFNGIETLNRATADVLRSYGAPDTFFENKRIVD